MNGLRRRLAALFALLALAACASTSKPWPTASSAAPAASRAASGFGGWRISGQTLYAGPSRAGGNAEPFRFSGLGASQIRIAIALSGARAATMTLECDGPFKLEGKGESLVRPARKRLTVALETDEHGRTGRTLLPAAEVRACEAAFSFPSGRRAIRLVREETSYPWLARLDSTTEACALPAAAGDRLKAAFLGTPELSQTCPFTPGKSSMLFSELGAFNARVEALAGRPLPEAFVRKGDPMAPIDFSGAPRLNLIYVSALDFKADFSGMVIARLLRFHAARGTPVRIMTSEVLERTKDRHLLEELARDYPNVSLKLFAYRPETILDPAETTAALHRTHHVKLFAALAEKPGRSIAIVGGRNIHDGFLFDQPVNLDRFPSLQHYGGKRALTLNYYSNWHDFDIAFHEDSTVRRLAAHFGAIWNEDALTNAIRPFSVSGKTAPPASGNARHFLSVPYRDGHALEKYYVSLIDAARTRIDIINPYLNPTKPISRAFDRAVARGVEISIIGRVDMRGDLGGEILTALNEEFVEANASRMDIADYKAPDVVLHAKILMIDRRLAVLSSVNFNNRSFLHDSENGVAILDAAFCRRLQQVFDYYRGDSNPVRPGMSWSLWKAILELTPLLKRVL